MEVCVDSVLSAINAARGGAARLELCSALSEGGLTPSLGTFKVIKGQLTLPIFVMIRPRRGTDFIYSPLEIEAMKEDIKLFKDNGCDGFVFGALNQEGSIDEESCLSLLNIATSLPVTFHRAFDYTVDPLYALEDLIKLGFKRILTSGQEENAGIGKALIKKLIERAKGRIVIMPGSGLTVDNLEEVLKETGAVEFHASARSAVEFFNPKKKNCSLGISDSNSNLLVADSDLVEKMEKIRKNLLGEINVKYNGV